VATLSDSERVSLQCFSGCPWRNLRSRCPGKHGRAAALHGGVSVSLGREYGSQPSWPHGHQGLGCAVCSSSTEMDSVLKVFDVVMAFGSENWKRQQMKHSCLMSNTQQLERTNCLASSKFIFIIFFFC